MQKELQGIIITVAFNKVYGNEGTNNEQKKNQVYQYVHGTVNDQNSISLIEQMLEAKGPFKWMFDKYPKVEGNGYEYHLKECLTRSNTIKLVVRKHITKKILPYSTLLSRK